MVLGELPSCQRARMSPDEVRACYRLYAAYYTLCGISPYRRMLASLVQLQFSKDRSSK
jgi:hypothetical protein